MILFPNLDPDDAQTLNETIARELEGELEGIDRDFDFVSDRFPSWPLLQHRDRCQKIPAELFLMARDKFEHELSALHQYVLYRSLEAWRAISADLAPGSPSDAERRERDEYTELLDYYIAETFEDEDFLSVEVFANAVLRGTDLMDEMGVSIENYYELLPDDIRRGIELQVAAKARGSTPGPSGNDGDADTPKDFEG